jgi:hypothetical protein
MSVDSDLRAFILADAAVAALIGTRLYPAIMPQDPVLPATTYQWISAIRYPNMDDAGGLSTARVQVDCWSDSKAEALEVFEAIRLALDGYRGAFGSIPVYGAFLESERESYEPATDAGTGSGVALYRRSGDYVITYEEALV